MPVAPTRPSSPSVSVVIPAGTATLPVLLATLPAVAEVIVVVGRDDDTSAVAVRATRVIRQTRAGVGNALACGVAESTGDIVVTLPGDGSGDPAELPRYVRALQDGADVAQGSRFRGGGRDLSGGPLSRFGVRILLWLMAALFGCRRTDPGFGFRAFWRDVAGTVGLPRVAGTDPVRGDGAEVEPLLSVRAGAGGLFVTEVPAVAYPRTAPATRLGLLPAARALIAERVAQRRAVRAAETDSIVVLTGRNPAASRPGLLGRTGTDAHPAGLAHLAPNSSRISSSGGPGGAFEGGFDPMNGVADRLRAELDRVPPGERPAPRWPATNPWAGSDRAARPGDPGPAAGRRGPEGVERRKGPRASGLPGANDEHRPGLPGSGDKRGFGLSGLGGSSLGGSSLGGSGFGGSGFGEAGAAAGGTGDATTVRRRWRDNRGSAAAREVGNGRRRMQGRPNLRVINGEGGGGGRTGKLRAVPHPDQNE
jgi:hypothetical protein